LVLLAALKLPVTMGTAKMTRRIPYRKWIPSKERDWRRV